MSDNEKLIVDRFFNATNAIGARIKRLLENQATMDDAEFNAALSKLADDAEALGKDGEVPPAEPPVV
jgi:hypothetical protein